MRSRLGSMPARSARRSCRSRRPAGGALQEIVDDHRLEDVQLEVAGSAAEVDRDVVARSPGQHSMVSAFALGRVDLARHDRAARLVLRDAELADAAARPAGQPAHVVGDLHQRGGHGLERAVGMHQRVVRRQRLELVGRGDERQPGQPARALPPRDRRTRVRVQARCRRRCRPAPARTDAAGPPRWRAVVELRDVAGELLAQRQRRRVLQVGAADLDDVGKGRRLGRQRARSRRSAGSRCSPQAGDGGDAHGGGEDVVRGLAEYPL